MGAQYTTVDRVYNLEPLCGSLSDLTSSQIVTAFIEPTEGEIHARISRRYEVPVADTVPVLIGIADDLVVYRILSRRMFTADQLKNSVWPDRFKESLETLGEIAKGTILLVNSAGTLISQRSSVAEAQSNVDNYLPTFHDGGGWLDQVKDGDKATDEADARSAVLGGT